MTAGRALLHAARTAASSLAAYPLRTSLAALGVTAGVAMVAAILAIVAGLDAAFTEHTAFLGAGVVYVTKLPWIVIGDDWAYRRRPPVTKGDAELLEARLELARAVVPLAETRADIGVGRTMLRGVRIVGTTARWPLVSGLDPAEGRFLGEGDAGGGARPVAVVGADVAEAMRREGEPLPGGTISIAGRPARVVGIFGARGRSLGQSRDDFIVVPAPVHERLFGTRGSMTIGVLFDPADVERGADDIVRALRRRRGVEPGADDGFTVNRQEHVAAVYGEVARLLFATALGLGLVTLAVGGVGIMNAMLVTVAERTHEIGVRKALGARPGTILLQFLVEAGVTSAAGGALGAALGLGIAIGIARATSLPAVASARDLIAGVVFGAATGILFGFLPALRASRLLPVRALEAGP